MASTFRYTVLCGLLLGLGCATAPQKAPEQALRTVDLALKYSPGQIDRYRVSSEVTRSVEWQGLSPNEAGQFKGGTTGRILDLTYTQRVDRVDPNGNADIEVTLDDIQYRGFMVGEPTLDYDSTRPDNPPCAMAGLVGAAYALRVGPDGRVLEVLDTRTAMARIDGKLPQAQTATRLVSDEAIESRHTIRSLASRPAGPATEGQVWPGSHAFSFDQMGRRTFDLTYTYRGLEAGPGGERAVIDMNSVSTPVGPHAPAMSALFHSRETYSGRTTLDPQTGRVVEHHEDLEVNWTFVDPTATPQAGEEPKSGQMTARQVFYLKRIDPEAPCTR